MEKKFLQKPPSAPVREAPRRWRAQKQLRPHSSPRAPTTRHRVRQEPALPSMATLSSGGRAGPGTREVVGILLGQGGLCPA